ncbi:deoxynucleoside kinase-like isoform X3 [Amphibalanus amphitrite]|uniref:deoxynucleoside kinase-like isoform X3 n=1 Tax=Amphibalanus amphitrite TaxID=1232801 RepID=UPI001C918CEE|nr:deoxynucleoside kinase-like isoform X3 [Amphibalanus amphitrite]
MGFRGCRSGYWRRIIHYSLASRSSNGLRDRVFSLIGGLKMSAGKKITICVEGNIGSGKTTLLDHFAQFPEVKTISEPVNKWRDAGGHNLLELMYSDPARYSCMFQSYVQLTMMDNHTAPVEKPIKMMERSIHSGRYCFIENLHRGGLMADAEYAVLDQWFQWITANVNVQPDLIVYLRTSPEVALERIRRRSRDEERAIPESYVRALHELHEDWLVRRAQFPVPCQVLVLDADQDLSLLKEEFNVRKQEILCRSEVKSPVKSDRPAAASAAAV